MRSRENPCYDSNSGRSCPDRCAGCSTKCKKWKKYVSKRNSEYAKQDKDKMLDSYEITRARRLCKGSGHDFHGV